MRAAVREGRPRHEVRSGDPAIYGAIHEQIAVFEREGIPTRSCPASVPPSRRPASVSS
ncbi:MAG: hypothetical protein U0531_05885 [Dehalococcoidia bacterium]